MRFLKFIRKWNFKIKKGFVFCLLQNPVTIFSKSFSPVMSFFPLPTIDQLVCDLFLCVWGPRWSMNWILLSSTQRCILKRMYPQRCILKRMHLWVEDKEHLNENRKNPKPKRSTLVLSSLSLLLLSGILSLVQKVYLTSQSELKKVQGRSSQYF